MLLSRSNKVLSIYTIGTGGMAGCFVDVKLVFASTLLSCAHKLILAHNHPSGNLQPSELDINMTRRIKEAGRVLDIQVLDHIIVTLDGYYIHLLMKASYKSKSLY
jgi:DNA repair protein RadC